MPCLLLAIKMTQWTLDKVPVFGKAAAQIIGASSAIATAVYDATTSSVFSGICKQIDNISTKIENDLEVVNNQVAKSMNTPSSFQTLGTSAPLGRPDLRELQSTIYCLFFSPYFARLC